MRLALPMLFILGAPALAEPVTATRLVIADHVSGAVAVLDATDGTVLLRHDAGAPARIAQGPHPGAVALYQGAAGRVTIVETGVTVEGHGDHADVAIAAPRVAPRTLSGPRPSHVVEGDGRLAAFFDGVGIAQVIRAAEPDAPPLSYRVAFPHHGVAVPFASREGERIAISSAPSEGAVADRLRLLRTDGTEVAESPSCPRVHGEARSGSTIAFGCLDGVLLLDAERGTFRKVGNPEGAGTRAVRNMSGGRDWRLFAADFGPDGMAVVDPDAGTIRMVGLPARRVHFALDADAADTVQVLTEDGVLHAVSTLDGTLRRSSPVTSRYALGTAGAALPRLSAAGGLIAVSDPAAGRVLLIDGATHAVRREIRWEGRPFDVRLIHAAGERH